MKCKFCEEEINLHIFGAPDDICFGCLTVQEKDQIVEDHASSIRKVKDADFIVSIERSKSSSKNVKMQKISYGTF